MSAGTVKTRRPPGVSIPASALYSLASILATPWIEARLAQTLKLLPAVAIETPHATTLWKRLATRLGVRPDIFHSIPHPIQTEIFKPNPSIAKKNQVISVGRWESYQKNYPLLVRTLVAFLEENPSWTALVVGSGLPPTPPHSRIFFSAPLSSVHLARQMQESKILLSSSRYESFGLAAAEALACGCALVSAWNHPFSFKVPGVSRQENPRHCLSLCAQNPAPAGKAVAWTKCLAPQKVASHILRLDY
jgi:glycosyltransferase involved in cell wall biosynthesis